MSIQLILAAPNLVISQNPMPNCFISLLCLSRVVFLFLSVIFLVLSVLVVVDVLRVAFVGLTIWFIIWFKLDNNLPWPGPPTSLRSMAFGFMENGGRMRADDD